MVSFPADLAQFWGAILGSGGVWRGLAGVSHYLKCLALVIFIPGVMLDILHQVSSGCFYNWFSTILGVPYDHTRQV